MEIRKEDVDRIVKLPCYGILANGRSGSDFLQSLFDGHPEVLTFNGFFLFYDFWIKACTNKVSSISLEDFADEFAGHFICKFKTRYDIQERKDQLGIAENESLDLSLEIFKKYLFDFLKISGFSSRNALLGATAAYHLCLGRDLSSVKVVLHHPHVVEECEPFLKDFPEATLILMTRDPRANFYSSVTNYSKYYPEAAGTSLILSYLESIIPDVERYLSKTHKVLAIKIETLDRQETHQKLCQEFGVQYHPCLTQSTWGGLLWHGDRLSQRKNKDPNSREILRNGWDEKISKRDLLLVNFFTRKMRHHYGYLQKETSVIWGLVIPFLIILPMTMEVPYLGVGQLKKNGFTKLLFNWFYYLKRVVFMKNLLLHGRGFSGTKYF